MESQIHQFDSSLKQDHNAQQAFANTLEDTWGKASKGAMCSNELAKPNGLQDKCGGLDFSNDIYGDKFGPTKFDSNPKPELFGDEGELKEDQLRSEKKDRHASGNMLEEKPYTGGKFEANQNGEVEAAKPDKITKGGEKSTDRPDWNEQQDAVGDSSKFFPGKGGLKSDKPNTSGTKLSERQANPDEFLI